jgi:hypothetical protein
MPSVTLKVVAREREDIQIIRTLLHKELPASTRFFATRGRVSLVTIGRNLLIDEGGPVLVVMNAETLSPQLKDERESLARFALSRAAAPGQFDVFSFVPEIEVVFFEVPAALEQALGVKVAPTTVEIGRLAPHKTLAQLLADAAIPDLSALIRKMDEQTIEMLARGEQASALADKIRSLSRLVAEPVS